MKIVGFSILAIVVGSGIVTNASAESCRPGERMMKDCNTCFCISGSGYACTNNVCVEGMFKDGSLKVPFSGSILRDKRQATSTERTCEPGKAFMHYCNHCRCGPDGLVKTAACTKMACPEGVYNEDGSLIQPLTDPTPRNKRQANSAERTCEPGKAFMHYCNHCRCGPDGLVKTAACTKMACPEGVYNEDGSLIQPLTDPTPRNNLQANSTERTCEPGKAFMHYCNHCCCGPDGLVKTAACTKMACPEGVYNEDGSLIQPLTDPTPRNKRQANSAERTCEPGKAFMHYCNHCRCGPDGLVKTAACTKMACPEGVYNEDGSLIQPLTDPTPRNKRQANSAERTCEPGKAFMHYCNHCRCGPDGLVKTAACTKMACPEGVYNEDGSLIQPLTHPTPRDKRQADGAGTTCTAGTSFKRYCNTCNCPTNGLRDSAACTLMACPDGVWNEDGSLKSPLRDPTPRDKRQANGAGATCVPGRSFQVRKSCQDDM